MKIVNWFNGLRNNQEWYRDQHVVLFIWLPLMVAVSTILVVYSMLVLGEVM